MSRYLKDLHHQFRPIIFEFLAMLTEAGISVVIIDTLRTPEEHAANLAAGKSWTKHSKHLDGLAIDVCPYESYQLHGTEKLQWNADNPVWQRIGAIGEALGLRWGGRWAQRDMGHFEQKVVP